MLVRELRTLDDELALGGQAEQAAQLHRLPAAEVHSPALERDAAGELRAVAPPVQSFASGRRR